jgi:hypothetical protein
MSSHIANYSLRITAHCLRPDRVTTRSAIGTMGVTADSHWNPFRRHVLGHIVEEPREPSTFVSAPKSKTWETTVDRVPSWPEEARSLKRHDWISYLFSIGDVILVLLPVYFIRMWKS